MRISAGEVRVFLHGPRKRTDTRDGSRDDHQVGLYVQPPIQVDRSGCRVVVHPGEDMCLDSLDDGRRHGPGGT